MGRFSTLFLFAAIAIAACSPTSESTTTTIAGGVATTTLGSTSNEPQIETPNGVIIGVGQSVTTLNPFAESASAEANIVGQAVWATAYDIVPETWERVPEIVTSLPSQTPGAIEVAEDGSMTVRYEVRQGAMWSDGIPVTGADVAFTAEAMAELALSGGANVDPIMATVLATDSVERLAWITFSETSLAFEDALWIVLPSHAIEGTADLRTTDGFDWPSGGPFLVTDFQQPGILSFERNPNYWKVDDDGVQLPYLDQLIIRSAGEPGQEVELFSSQSVDVIVLPPDDDVLGAISGGAELQQVPTPILEHLTFQFGSGRDEVNPASNNDLLDYRKAVAHSLDRSALIAETGVPWMREIPGVLIPVGQSAWRSYAFSTTQSETLIQGMGGEDARGLPPWAVLSTTGNGDYRVRIGDALVGSFGDIGVALETSYLDSLIFFGEQLGAGEFDIGMWAWIGTGGYGNQIGLMELFDPASDDADASFGAWGEGQSASDGSAAFSELVGEARTTVDPQRFMEIVESAEQLLAENLPLIPLFQRSSVAAIWTDSLEGVIHNGSKSDVTWNVEWWQKPGG